MKNLIKIIASFFYLGYVPFAPGTAGSLGALLIYLFFLKGNFLLHSVIMSTVTVLGYLVCTRAEKIFGRKDAPRIVIDEAAGMLLAFWGLQLDPLLILLGFLIFRVLDAVKPYPADRIEKLPGAAGVMGDDLLCGLYTNIVLQLVTRVFLTL